MTAELKLADVIDGIQQRAVKYKTDYGIQPFDVCLGPEEFRLMYREGRDEGEAQINRLSQVFYKGMRVRMMTSPGILVGTLTMKTP